MFLECLSYRSGTAYTRIMGLTRWMWFLPYPSFIHWEKTDINQIIMSCNLIIGGITNREGNAMGIVWVARDIILIYLKVKSPKPGILSRRSR
jgi:hypothetical protein